MHAIIEHVFDADESPQNRTLLIAHFSSIAMKRKYLKEKSE
jgi:hypothetical protein